MTSTFVVTFLISTHQPHPRTVTYVYISLFMSGHSLPSIPTHPRHVASSLRDSRRATRLTAPRGHQRGHHCCPSPIHACNEISSSRKTMLRLPIKRQKRVHRSPRKATKYHIHYCTPCLLHPSTRAKLLSRSTNVMKCAITPHAL